MSQPTTASATVTITRKEYDELCRDSVKLECLVAAGVDNWDGWDDAMDIFQTSLEESGLPDNPDDDDDDDQEPLHLYQDELDIRDSEIRRLSKRCAELEDQLTLAMIRRSN